MKIELDNSLTHPYRINSYERGSIVIGDERFVTSLIITPSIVINNWPPKTFTDIATHHLEQIIELKPELILLGTGSKQHFPDTDLLLSAAKLNIEGPVFRTPGDIDTSVHAEQASDKIANSCSRIPHPVTVVERFIRQGGMADASESHQRPPRYEFP